jgi:hypothetical protein
MSADSDDDVFEAINLSLGREDRAGLRELTVEEEIGLLVCQNQLHYAAEEMRLRRLPEPEL